MKEELENYLKTHAKFMKQNHGSAMKDYQYNSCEELVLHEGKHFAGTPLPKQFKHGKMKLCYMNSFYLAEKESNKLIYCEGIATGIIPVVHAWCITHDGIVVDPTWRDSEKCDYWGIPFRMEFVIYTMLKTKVFGVLDNWKDKWPLLKKFDKTVKAELNV